MSHLDSRWRVCWSNTFPSWGAECLQGSSHVSRAGCLSLPPGIPAGSGWHDATLHTGKSFEHDARATKWDSPQKVIVVNSLSSRLTPIKSAEIFVAFKRSKVKIRAFCFLEPYGILLLGTLFVVHSLEKIHAVCIIPGITWLSQRLWLQYLHCPGHCSCSGAEALWWVCNSALSIAPFPPTLNRTAL